MTETKVMKRTDIIKNLKDLGMIQGKDFKKSDTVTALRSLLDAEIENVKNPNSPAAKSEKSIEKAVKKLTAPAKKKVKVEPEPEPIKPPVVPVKKVVLTKKQKAIAEEQATIPEPLTDKQKKRQEQLAKAKAIEKNPESLIADDDSRLPGISTLEAVWEAMKEKPMTEEEVEKRAMELFTEYYPTGKAVPKYRQSEIELILQAMTHVLVTMSEYDGMLVPKFKEREDGKATVVLQQMIFVNEDDEEPEIWPLEPDLPVKKIAENK